jgi:hypothetical protein
MKWLALSITALALGGVAAFAIYTWGWHDRDGDGDDVARAATYSRQVVAFVGRFQDPNPVWHADQVTGDLWTLRLEGVKGRGTMCFTMDLSKFAPRPSGQTIFDRFYGLAESECPP